MKRILTVLLALSAALFALACEGGTETTGNTDGNTAEPPKTVEATLIELDKSAGEAWAKSDGKFFENFASDNFVGQGSQGAFDKATLVRAISGQDCDIKSTSTSDQKITEVADGVALFTGKSSADGTCNGDKLKDEYFGSLYVKDGDTWKGAFYQTREVPAKEEAKPDDAAKPDEKAAAADDAKKEDASAEGSKEEKPDGDDAKKEEAPPAPKIPNDEALAKTLGEIENSLWAAWAKKDTKPFEDVLAANFVEVGENGAADRATVMSQIAGHKCEVSSSALSNMNATKVNDNFVILTYTGNMKVTCDGKPAPEVSHVTTIFQKDGDNWKVLFHMETPGKKA